MGLISPIGPIKTGILRGISGASGYFFAGVAGFTMATEIVKLVSFG